MRPILNHDFNLTPSAAINLQKQLSGMVKILPPPKNIRYIAGIDCAPSLDKSIYFAIAVIWDLKFKKLIEYHIDFSPLVFPYIPGLLSFREIPAVLKAMEKIITRPDVLMLDGHGIAHPRGFGIASHVGVLFDIPTLGCAKSLLYGHYKQPVVVRGSISPLLNNGNVVIGNVIRTRTNVKPIFASVGHNIDLDTVTKLILNCNGRFRLPEPIHLADKLVAQKTVRSVIIV